MDVGKHWINTNHDYGFPYARFYISSRYLLHLGNCDLRGVADVEKPEVMQKIVYDLIEELRPDLDGCILIAIEYKLHPLHWELTIAHRNLKPVPNGYMPPLLSLIPQQGLVENTDPVPVEMPES